MPRKISVPVLCNSNGLYLNNTQTIDATAQVIGIQPIPDKLYPPGHQKVFVDILFVNDPNFGGLYLQLTQDQYNSLVRTASQDPNKSVRLNYLVPSGTPAGVLIINSELYNATILLVTVNGVSINTPSGYNYSQDDVAKTGMISLHTGLVDTDSVAIMLYYN